MRAPPRTPRPVRPPTRPATPRPPPRRPLATPARAAAANDPAAALAEVAANDKLIDTFLECKGPQQLSQAVAENLLALDQKFWIRVAARADTADEAGKLQLSSLARAVMQLVEAAVSVTDSQLDAGGAALQRVLAAGADDAGEWRLPLDADALARMRAALADAGAAVDEAFLSSAFAWMRKAAADGNDGVVSLIQTVLQLYAGAALTASPSDDPSDAALNSVLGAPEPEWGAALAGVRAGVGAAAFDAALRRRMEAVALGLPSGSYAQRVQAEYLKEVEARAKDALGGKGQ